MQVTSAELAVVVAKPAQLPDHSLPQIAFAGRSNVGKSSLINVLARRKKLARTSGTPGKTRMLFYYLMNQAFYFVDLPGYGYARIARTERAYFKVLVDAYFKHSKSLRGCVLLLDPRRPVGEEEISMLHYLATRGTPALVVFTKWDRVRSSKRASLLKHRKGELAGTCKNILCVSSANKEGLDQLEHKLDRLLYPLETIKDKEK